MLELTPITAARSIRAAEKSLRARLQNAAGHPISVRVGHQGGQSEMEAWWLAEDDFWFVSYKANTRWWNGFGLGEPEEDGTLSLIVEINPPLHGIDRRMGGAFLRDAEGTVYLAHTGKVGGGRKGIGKRQFLKYFDGSIHAIDGAEYIVIGAIEAEDFTTELAEFIRTVDRFKRDVAGTRAEATEDEDEDEDEDDDELVDDQVAPSYWKISADTGSREWDEWHAENYIGVGWNNLGDLSDVDQEGFDERVRRVLEEHPDWKRPRLDQVWRFAKQIQEGARVVVNRGTSRVLAFGTVTGAYHFVPDVLLGHRIPVRWDDVDERVIERGGWRKTLIQLKRADFEELLGAPRVGEESDEDEEILDAEPEERLNFDGLVARLGNEGLRFDSETLASYLLALQSKRFVILSGISGTGKTALALEVARALAPTGRGDTGSRTNNTRVTVMPYMLKYRRLVIPKVVADELAALDGFADEELHVYYGEPDEEDECRLRISAGTTAYQLLFRREFRAWFEETFDEGSEVALSVYVNDDDTPSLVVHDAEDVGEELQHGGVGYRSIAVRPDWTDNRGLLGYYNPITSQYQTTPFLELLLAAAAEARRASEQGRAAEPYLVILDEMNLARVEHYFSDFLSSMESGEPLHLHDDAALAEGLSESGEPIPRELTIPRNLFFTGTVNVDETTYMFSPKVLDRAFVLEFNEVDLRGYGRPAETEDDEDQGGLYLGGFDGRLGLRGRGDHHKPGPKDWEHLRELSEGDFADALTQLNDLLAVDLRHFGYRVANEISRFMRLAAEQGGQDQDSLWAAFDIAVLAKVLPKLHGTEQELGELLESLLGFAVAGEQAKRQTETNWTLSQDRLNWKGEGDPPQVWLPRTAAKLWRMLRRLRQRGFVSFIE